jgi:NADPH-ferrihemoprotein reductase
MTLGLRRPVTTKNPVYARCSSYLSSLKPQVDQIHANFLKSSFIFPRHDRKPIVMIATGTGIAPFRAFLQELIFEKKRLEKNITSTFDSLSIGINTISTGSQKRRNAYLFYGCRDASQDFLYHQEILDAASREIDPEPLLDELVVQFSKMVSSKNLWIDDTDEATNQYVQHALEARKSFLYDHLIKEKGYIYICGSLSMGREVKKVLEEVLRNEKNNINLQELIDKKQIITELW